MRVAKALFCAAAFLALSVQGVRADDYNKLTYFTFSAPVQVPGVTLPAGKYTFKLADPESGRRAIQIWDEEGKKLLTTLLTVTNERIEMPKEPMVMFNEQPSGEPPAVRAWFYEGERAGYEFVYPKDQAMKIAKATHQPVLSTDNTGTDLSALNAAKVSRVDESGASADAGTTAAATTTSSASTASTTTTSSASSADSTSTAPAPTASSTNSASASTSTASTASPASTASTTSTATTTAPEPSANRTEPTAAVARADTTAPTPEPVGTSGSVQADSARPAATSATQAAAPQAADPRPTTTVAQNRDAALPRTASSLYLLGLLSGVCLALGLGVRSLRNRLA